MADPVSWMLIEEGWRVVSADGEHLGHVTAVHAEVERDIFDGIEFRHLIFEQRRYVPSDQVDGIVEGEVTLALSAEQAHRLPPAG